MFYEEEMDRYHSVQFHYDAGTENKPLKSLAVNLWSSFSEADQTEIELKANRKSRLTGLQYVELIVIQLFSHWHTDVTLCLSTPRARGTKNTKDFYNPTGVSTPKLVKVFNALEAYEYVDRVNHTKSSNPEFTKAYQEQLMAGPALTKTVRHKQSLTIFEEWKQSLV